ncbi:MAG: hypothetical protein WCL19_05930 [Verrucomicrobiota bacterium]
MNWIFDHFQIVVLILLIVASVVKKQSKLKAKSALPDLPPGLPGPLQEDMASPPPPQIRDDGKTRLPMVHDTRVATTGDAAATRARVAAQTQKKPLSLSPVTLGHRLRDRGEVRRAIIMREILDPPVGLR